ncbi:MAG: acyltransferase [Clostridium sp.]|uniref:acyltransferase n=1 Tax=Clostridium sp. TaxID=1506 RepID=UPI003F306915
MNKFNGIKQERNINLELLRIVAMIMIVALHYISKSAIGNNVIIGSKEYFFLGGIKALSTIAVNLFIIINGYFIIEFKFKLRKLIYIWAQVVFYSVGIYLFICFFEKAQMSLVNLAYGIFPITMNTYWFASVYTGLYIISPVIKKVIISLEKSEFKRIMIIGTIIFTIIPIMPLTYGLDLSRGYGIIHFCYLTFVGAYLRVVYKSKSRDKKGYLVMYFLISGFVVIIMYIFQKFNFGDYYFKLYEYNSISMVLSSVGLFLYFKEVKLTNKHLNRIIRESAKLTFGVYLIHDNYLIRNFIYYKVLKTEYYSQSKHLILITIISILLIVVISMIIDFFRKKLFDGNLFEVTIGKISDKATKLGLKIENIFIEC